LVPVAQTKKGRAQKQHEKEDTDEEQEESDAIQHDDKYEVVELNEEQQEASLTESPMRVLKAEWVSECVWKRVWSGCCVT
jgi:hypothetical protein